jgi:hypothetical protein
MNIRLDQMTWAKSRAWCANFIEKDREHGSKLPYRSGDKVVCPAGRGTLVHKEHLRYDTSLGRDVWYLKVLIQAREYVYSDPEMVTPDLEIAVAA